MPSVKRRWLKTTLSRAATTFDRTNRAANLLLLTVFCAAALAMPGCAGTTSTGTAVVTIAVLPTQVSVPLSQSQQFQAIVTGTSNKSVTWFAGGIAGGSATAGTISPSGLYTAPSAMPSPPTVTVTASAMRIALRQRLPSSCSQAELQSGSRPLPPRCQPEPDKHLQQVSRAQGPPRTRSLGA
jgi:hypothetical protein